MRPSQAQLASWRLAVATVVVSQTLLLIGCSLPTRPISPTGRYGQVNITVQTNAGIREATEWPLLVIRSMLTGEEHLLRRQKAPTVDSDAYAGRAPPGRYRLLGLVSNPTVAAKKLVLTKSLGSFNVLANEQCQLGSVLHWQQARQPITRSLRSAAQKLCWNPDDQDRQRARHFAERQQTLSPPANLGSGPVLRHSGLLSYRRNRNQAWQVIDSGAVNITAATELSPNELLIGGEQGLLIYSKNRTQQRLPLKPADSAVLALTTTESGVAILLSTKNTLQLLHSQDIHNTPWQVVATSDSGYQKVAAEHIRWSVTDNRFAAQTDKGKRLLVAELP